MLVLYSISTICRCLHLLCCFSGKEIEKLQSALEKERVIIEQVDTYQGSLLSSTLTWSLLESYGSPGTLCPDTLESYRIRLIRRTVLNKRTPPPPPPQFFADFGGPASTKDRLLMLNFYCFSRMRRYIDGDLNCHLLAISCCGMYHRDRHSLWDAVIRMFDKTPATETFSNLHPYGALNQANTVIWDKAKNQILKKNSQFCF